MLTLDKKYLTRFFFRKRPKINLCSGFLAAEIVLATTTLTIIALAVGGLLTVGQDATQSAGKRVKAVLLAEEGLEAARNIRDSSYVNLEPGEHGLALVGSEWSFSGAADVTTTELHGVPYTRVVTVATSEEDSDARLVSVVVTWPQNQLRSGSVTLSTIISDWQREVIPEDIVVEP